MLRKWVYLYTTNNIFTYAKQLPEFDEEKCKQILISPCDCNGSSKYVHHDCLNKWIIANYTVQTLKTAGCELCKCNLMIVSKIIKNKKLYEDHLNKYIKALILIILVIIIINIGYIVIVTQAIKTSFDFSNASMYIFLTFNLLFAIVVLYYSNKFFKKIGISMNKDTFVILDKSDPRYKFNIKFGKDFSYSTIKNDK